MTELIEPSAIAIFGAGVFVLGYGHLMLKAKEDPKGSYLIHYLPSLILLTLGVAMFFIGLELRG